MTDADLAQLFAATEAPAFDHAFELAVEEKIARRRVAIAGAGLALLASLVIGLVAMLWPLLSTSAGVLVETFDPAGPSLACVAAIIAASLWFANYMSEPRFADD